MQNPEDKSLPKRYVRWQMISVSLLCAGIIFLFEALTRIDTVSLGGINFTHLTTWTPIIFMFSVLCANRAQKNQYTTTGLRWNITSVILLTIGLLLLFETMAKVDSDIFAGFNFIALALISSFLCSISVILENYSQKFEVDKQDV